MRNCLAEGYFMSEEALSAMQKAILADIAEAEKTLKEWKVAAQRISEAYRTVAERLAANPAIVFFADEQVSLKYGNVSRIVCPFPEVEKVKEAAQAIRYWEDRLRVLAEQKTGAGL
jgi:hypothetical protein